MFLTEDDFHLYEHSHLKLVHYEEATRRARSSGTYLFTHPETGENSCIDFTLRESEHVGSDFLRLETDTFSHFTLLETIFLHRQLQEHVLNNPKRRLLYVTGERRFRLDSPHCHNLERWEERHQQLLSPTLLTTNIEEMLQWLKDDVYKDCSSRIQRLKDTRSAVEIDLFSTVRKPTVSLRGESGKKLVDTLVEMGFGEMFSEEDSDLKSHEYEFYLHETNQEDGLYNYVYFQRFHQRLNKYFHVHFGNFYKQTLMKQHYLIRQQRNLV